MRLVEGHHVVPRAPPLSAFFIRDGNKLALVKHIGQRSVGVKQEALYHKEVSLLLQLIIWNIHNSFMWILFYFNYSVVCCMYVLKMQL